MTPEASPSARLTPSLERHEAAIEALLNEIIRHGQFQLSFTLGRPGLSGDDLQTPEIVVDFSGPDTQLLLEANGELLNALEYVVLRAVRLEEELFPRITFDCEDWRRLRAEELKLTAQVAADRVCATGAPFPLGPMAPRERRIIHLALRDRPEVRTESQGRGSERKVVIHPASSPARPG